MADEEASHPSQIDRYADMPADTPTRSGIPLGILRAMVIANESKSTADARGVSPYDVMAIGPGVVHNAQTAPTDEMGFPSRAPVLSAWGVPSQGAGAFQFEKELWHDVAKQIGPLPDFGQRSQDAVFNYVVTGNMAGKSGFFPWEKNFRLAPTVRWLQNYYGSKKTGSAGR